MGTLNFSSVDYFTLFMSAIVIGCIFQTGRKMASETRKIRARDQRLSLLIGWVLVSVALTYGMFVLFSPRTGMLGAFVMLCWFFSLMNVCRILIDRSRLGKVRKVGQLGKFYIKKEITDGFLGTFVSLDGRVELKNAKFYTNAYGISRFTKDAIFAEITCVKPWGVTARFPSRTFSFRPESDFATVQSGKIILPTGEELYARCFDEGLSKNETFEVKLDSRQITFEDILCDRV